MVASTSIHVGDHRGSRTEAAQIVSRELASLSQDAKKLCGKEPMRGRFRLGSAFQRCAF
jgi:hypothetical protein